MLYFQFHQKWCSTRGLDVMIHGLHFPTSTKWSEWRLAKLPPCLVHCLLGRFGTRCVFFFRKPLVFSNQPLGCSSRLVVLMGYGRRVAWKYLCLAFSSILSVSGSRQLCRGRHECCRISWWENRLCHNGVMTDPNGKPFSCCWQALPAFMSFRRRLFFIYFFANQCCTQLWDKGILFLSLVCAQNHFERKLLGPINGCSCRSWPGQCRESLLLLRIHVAVQRVWEFGMGPTVFV